jgi:hypothetical protein
VIGIFPSIPFLSYSLPFYLFHLTLLNFSSLLSNSPSPMRLSSSSLPFLLSLSSPHPYLSPRLSPFFTFSPIHLSSLRLTSSFSPFLSLHPLSPLPSLLSLLFTSPHFPSLLLSSLFTPSSPHSFSSHSFSSHSFPSLLSLPYSSLPPLPPSPFPSLLSRPFFLSLLQDLVVITGPVYAPMYVLGEWVSINRTIGIHSTVLYCSVLYCSALYCTAVLCCDVL